MHRFYGVLIILVGLFLMVNVAYPQVVPPPTELDTLSKSSAGDGFYLWTEWDANTEVDLKGYKIYYGRASRDYIYAVDVPSTKVGWSEECSAGGEYDPFKLVCCEFRVDIASTSPGVYYFAATAYDEDGNESAYSEELTHFFYKHVPKINAPTDLVNKRDE